ncbi:lactonase family protein [Roseateles asaccharophilus]|uniref:6-phosphogluconolactonase n=1 Tax=Roseateles asaccharophilus TaxID=582607 RepID=A0ABU2A6D0_9BURK|nr:lactonase family protein [Roseateles asaccharophilus]MDR7332751.1 6-phosphogluconolactonase [Roseateles asaccharophilus]
MKRLSLALLTTLMPFAIAAETLVYVGTDTGGDSKGIYVSTLDEATGALSPPRLAAAIGNPGFLAVHASKPLVYSVAGSRAADGSWKEEVAAFAVQGDGSLMLINTRPSGGGGPCHVSIDASGRVLLLANYGGGNVVSYPIQDDGSLGPAVSSLRHEGRSVNAQRQEAPHPHAIYPDPTQTRAYVPDLGIDKVMIYRLDAASGRLSPNVPAFAATEAGGGPRHLAFHPNGRHAYVALELTSRVAAYRVDGESGALDLFQTVSGLPPSASADGNTAAEILVHESGRFLYVSNRGHDSISVFAIDAQDGSLRFVGATPSGGRTPRSFGLVPGGRFLVAANQNGGNVTVFRIDAERGTLSATGQPLPIDRPKHVRFLRR